MQRSRQSRRGPGSWDEDEVVGLASAAGESRSVQAGSSRKLNSHPSLVRTA